MRARRQRRRTDAQQQGTPFFQRIGRQPDTSAAEGGTFFQTKLTLGQPGDRFEREADRTADAVVNRLAAGATDTAALRSKGTLQRRGEQEENLQAKRQLQRQPDEEPESVQSEAEEQEESVQAQNEEDESLQAQSKEEEEPLQAQTEEEESVQAQNEKEEKETAQSQTEEEQAPIQAQTEEQGSVQMRSERKAAQGKTEQHGQATRLARNGQGRGQGEERRPDPSFAALLRQQLGKGHPLPPRLRAEMEAVFGADFGAVRIHTDESAARLNKMLGAQAFTRGNDIFFNAGRFNPDTSEGKHLLAHELTHTKQQGK